MLRNRMLENTAEEGPIVQTISVKQELIEEPELYHFVKAKEAALGYTEEFLNIVNIKQEELEAEGDVISRNADEPIFMVTELSCFTLNYCLQELAWDVMKTFNLTSEGDFYWMPYRVS